MQIDELAHLVDAFFSGPIPGETPEEINFPRLPGTRETPKRKPPNSKNNPSPCSLVTCVCSFTVKKILYHVMGLAHGTTNFTRAEVSTYHSRPSSTMYCLPVPVVVHSLLARTSPRPKWHEVFVPCFVPTRSTTHRLIAQRVCFVLPSPFALVRDPSLMRSPPAN